MKDNWHDRQRRFDQKVKARLQRAIKLLDNDKVLEHMNVEHMQEVLIIAKRLKAIKDQY